MNKKIVALIIIIFISFCFISIAVADNNAHNDKNISDNNNKSVDKNKIDKNNADKNKTKDKNKTDDKSKKNYILAMGSGNDISFSDGFRGFRLDYSKPAASAGDEFKRASASSVSNSDTLKRAVIESYKQSSSGQVGKVMDDFINSGSSSSNVGEAAENSRENVNGVVKINDDTGAVFNFEVLKSVSGNESDYFAYTVSYVTLDDENDNQTNNLTNVTNITTNITNNTNLTNMTPLMGNDTNLTFLNDLYAYLAFLANALFDAWKPIISTLLNGALMFINALLGLSVLYGEILAEIQSFIYALDQLLKMLASLWGLLDGIYKLLAWILGIIQQILNLINALLNFIFWLIGLIIALIQQILAWLLALLQFLLDLIYQILALLKAIFDFLVSVGSFLLNVIGNAMVIIVAFVLITVGAFVYDRIR